MSGIRVGGYCYPVTTLGYGKRLAIWLQGCDRACVNCISPELRPRQGGKLLSMTQIREFLKADDKPDGLTISGGEPFDQPEGLFEIVKWFSGNYSQDILIFTGYTLAQLKEKNSEIIDEILSQIAVLVDGEYKEEQNDGIGLRGSSNQTIHIWNYKERYEGVETWRRQVQCVFRQGRIWMIGIPSS